MEVLMFNSAYYLRGVDRCFFDLSGLLSDHGHKVIPFCMHQRVLYSREAQRNVERLGGDTFAERVVATTVQGLPELSAIDWRGPGSLHPTILAK